MQEGPDTAGEGDPLARGLWIGASLCAGATWLGSAAHPLVGLGVGALSALVATRVGLAGLEPLRTTLLSLPVKRPRRGNPDFAEMTQLVERARERVGDVLSQVRQERNDLIAILQGTTNGIVVLDGEDRIERINDAAHQMLSSPPDALGRKLEVVVRQLQLLDLVRRARQGLRPEPHNIEFPGRNGKRVLRITGVDLPEQDGTTRVLVAMHDVTDLRHLEAVRTDFVTNVTHEMRSPLASILGFAETLAEEPGLEAHVTDGLERIARNSRRLDSIIGDLIELSRLEHAESADLASVDPAQLLLDVATIYSDAAEEKQIRIVLKSEGLPDRAPLDAAVLTQALTNLVDNAVKYSPEGSTVTLSGRQVDDRLELIIEDQGPGIPREHRARIFERFYRVDAARSRAVGGTGLGLSIVKHAVALHGGVVRAEGELGVGCRFVLSLPWTPS